MTLELGSFDDESFAIRLFQHNFRVIFVKETSKDDIYCKRRGQISKFPKVSTLFQVQKLI